jgi:hypothetical protein
MQGRTADELKVNVKCINTEDGRKAAYSVSMEPNSKITQYSLDRRFSECHSLS